MTERISQVNQLIKKELSQIIFKEMEFPSNILVTVTRVESFPNLIEAKVYISVMPESQAEKILQILNKNIYGLQQKLNKRLKMRPIPKICFVVEKETARAGRIEEILAKLKSKR